MKELKDRKEFAKLLDEVGAKVIVEVGVRDGYFSKYLLDNSNIDKLYAVDPWELNSELMVDPEGIYNICKNNFKPYGDRAEMIKGYSPSASEFFQDNSLDFVYIDGAHDYESVKNDIEAWYSKIKPGAILAGHDFHLEDWPGVFNAVMEFVQTNDLDLNLTGYVGIDFSDPCHDGAKQSWWFYKK